MLVGSCIEVSNAAKCVGVIFAGIKTIEQDGLIALQSRPFVDGTRIKTTEAETRTIL